MTLLLLATFTLLFVRCQPDSITINPIPEKPNGLRLYGVGSGTIIGKVELF